MEAGFETIGNATLICYDRAPVLVTDPWIVGSAYFGSWILSHEIPEEQMSAIKSCEYVWISHGHPDHLSGESLDMLKNKKILLPDHVGCGPDCLRKYVSYVSLTTTRMRCYSSMWREH
jgi:L-ascorbate metabolism protein UlaG (beta-lactamase superfamily)